MLDILTRIVNAYSKSMYATIANIPLHVMLMGQDECAKDF